MQQWRTDDKFRETKFIFPNAPIIPVTVSGGNRMPGWYNIMEFDDPENRTEDEVGILRSREIIYAIIRGETDAGIPPERIVLGGFSQGGSLSLVAGITHSTKLGGIFGLSCLLLLKDRVEDMMSPDPPSKDTPIFMGHGDLDHIVKHAWGQASFKWLRRCGWNAEFHTYEGIAHDISSAEISDLGGFIFQSIPDLRNDGF